MELKKIALIPARSGSKRVPDKNIKILDGHPLLAFTVHAAVQSGVFDSVVCVTDSDDYAEIAKRYGAEVPFLRPKNISGDKSPDIDWVVWILSELTKNKLEYDVFSILRPTSPFRTANTIKRAWNIFIGNSNADSLRAVEKCQQHPGKMWIINNNNMTPLLPFSHNNVPWHSNQYAALPDIYVQNASLEIAWTRVILNNQSITGDIIVPFLTEDLEGFDINVQEDWMLAEHYIEGGEMILPTISLPIKQKIISGEING